MLVDHQVMVERNGIQISSIVLRSAMRELFAFLEEPFQKELIKEMDVRGIHLLDQSSYTLADVEQALHDIFW